LRQCGINAGRFPLSICPAFEYRAFFSGDAVTGKKNNFIGLMITLGEQLFLRMWSTLREQYRDQGI
ncbi:hypothetical protein JEK36_27250, partial [Klebsiella pneumoniae]|nr:hypothetical protein [Klebsiella pneumoniae]MCM0882453.1 hypothetical protein [Klebsiella pneumoniae]MCM0897077.1 hypothetical protein [Klebsiella pneumoniae]MCQ8311259.1 hypothetical protein [Klebsiella pneumoniae]MCQ8497824.1 hypothetical protein [Klebsiella pneumoniae]